MRKERRLENSVLCPEGEPPDWSEDHDEYLRQNAGSKWDFELQLGLDKIGKMKSPVDWIKKRTEELGLRE